MINIAICDDESVEIDYVSTLVHQWIAARAVDARLTAYENAESFLFAYEDDSAVDILLLDIQMKGMDGVALARKIREGNEAVQIVFITGYPDFMSDGYDVSALHYLMKPVEKEKLLEVLDKALERLSRTQETLVIKTADGTVKVPLRDIQYIEAFAHYVMIQTQNAAIETRASIGEMEKAAGVTFARCHRSYVVGLRHISRVTRTDVILDTGKAIPLSRRLYAEINLAFIGYHKGRKL